MFLTPSKIASLTSDILSGTANTTTGAKIKSADADGTISSLIGAALLDSGVKDSVTVKAFTDKLKVAIAATTFTES